MHSESLEILSSINYSTKCLDGTKVHILKCEYPFTVDECGMQDPNILRIVAKHSENEHKIYLYNLK